MLKKKLNKKHILLTGGHAGSTAYALIRQIKVQNKPWELSWIGPKKAMEGRNTGFLEQDIFPGLGIDSYTIDSGRIQRKFSRWTIPSILKIPKGFLQAIYLVRRIKPDLILSFGGFSAFPVVVASWLYKIPVLVHEQTACAGRANIYSAFFAKKILVSRDSSKKYFPKNKI